MADEIYQTLRADIIRLAIKPGDTLSEAEIAKRFDVSRQPVREAFIQLSDDRFLKIRPQRPTVVEPISERAVLNAQFIREAIEVAVIAQAALVWNARANAELADCIAAQKDAAQADDREAFHAADEHFHQIIAEHAGYPFAWDAVDQHKAQMDRVRYLTLGFATRYTIAEHEAIASALSQNDADASVAAMRLHLGKIKDHLSGLRAAHAHFFEDDQPALSKAG